MAKTKKKKAVKKIKRFKKIISKKTHVKKPAKRRPPLRKATASRRKILVKKRKILVKKTRKISKKRTSKKTTRRRVANKKALVRKTNKTRDKKPRIKKAVKKVAKKVRPAPEKHLLNQAESLFKAKIKVIGIGGGGGSIVSEIGRSLEKATFVIADTDIRALKKRAGIKYFCFGQELTRGLGTGANVELAKQAAEAAKEKLSPIFKDQDIIIFVASLGGGLGSGATQVFAEAAKHFGGITFGIFTMPFRFEGKTKNRIAQSALKALRSSLNVSLVIPNEKIFKIIDESTPITSAFSIVNKNLIESLESLIDLIYSPGIINIDFADLRTILRGVGNNAFLNTVEESGKDRAEKVCEKVFKNPLLQNSFLGAEKILFNIAGAENLSMFEVEKISSHISNLNPKAKIIFGISKNSKLKNKIKTTILMTGGQIKEPAPVKGKEEIKVVVAEEKKQAPVVPVVKKKKAKILKSKKAPVSFIPVFEPPVIPIPILEQRKLDIVETVSDSSKKTIRRSGLEIRKAEELQEKKRIAQEKEWEIPAFLRKVKFRN